MKVLATFSYLYYDKTIEFTKNPRLKQTAGCDYEGKKEKWVNILERMASVEKPMKT